jgi:SAM-dependent methyltransferase
VQHRVEWGIPPVPEWYDHYLDVHWQWPKGASGFFVERGVFGSLAISKPGSVLDLCCGDGFNTRHFYAPRAERVVAVDFDPSAVRHARTRNAHPRIEYQCRDIRNGLPEGSFDNVAWDAAIEHFTEAEIDGILSEIRSRLTERGVLSGYTIVAAEGGTKLLVHHEKEFSGKQELLGFLLRAFPYACVFETVHPARTNLYFYASRDAAQIPFSPKHAGSLWALEQ